MNQLRPYAAELWFKSMSQEQQVVYETRIGSLIQDDKTLYDWAHELAYREAMEVEETQ
jgi:hypothetical protein